MFTPKSGVGTPHLGNPGSAIVGRGCVKTNFLFLKTNFLFSKETMRLMEMENLFIQTPTRHTKMEWGTGDVWGP